MNWKDHIHNRGFRMGLSVLLTLAILWTLGYPGLQLRTAQPKDPLLDQQIQDITVLQVGENISSISPIAVPDRDGEGQAETHPEQTEPEITEPRETEPPETESRETEPKETEPPKTEPEETGKQETEPDETVPNAGSGNQGQEDGDQGEEGGEVTEPEIALVMTWYQNGIRPRTILCKPSETVGKTINTAQLVEDLLHYDFSFTGGESKNLEIVSVSVAEGDGLYREIPKSGEMPVFIPEGTQSRSYTFLVKARGETLDLTFTYEIHCENLLDLELELSWQTKDGTTGSVSCAADKAVSRTLESHDLENGTFAYVPLLTGSLAGNAKITLAEFRTASGQSGGLDTAGGTLMLQSPEGSMEETYYLSFRVLVRLRDEDGDSYEKTVSCSITLVYRQTLDLKLGFTWLENGVTRRTLSCGANDTVSTNIRNNQLKAGALTYEMILTGSDSEEARILSVSCGSESGESAMLHTNAGGSVSGSLPMSFPAGNTSVAYTLTVEALACQQRVTFEIVLRYSHDVSLQMQYTVVEDGRETTRSVSCENGKTRTAEAIYDDQLPGGILSYVMTVTGENARGIEITGIECYQSGSGKKVTLSEEDSLRLLLEGGKTGENTFTVLASGSEGQSYQFTINVPYKHRGEKTVKITTNLMDGMTVTNETRTNLTVSAWTEDENGNIVSKILASGTDTKLIVQLDGKPLSFTSASGSSQEYALHPENPESGDENTHSVYIYAEDAYGNFGELTLTLKGQRNQAGQTKGTATLYIDMTVLGLGVQGPVSYRILAEEPASYAVAKAVWGLDAGDPFGHAENTFGWYSGSYGGSLDVGFYLRSLSPGGSISANALSGWSWNDFGSTGDEVLQYIDNRFGRGTGLATLWRCIYRNGLNLGGASTGSIGEQDYTSGSGWLYSIGGGAYYPGDSLSAWYLNDGDVLTLRYTLAYGWDVGGGSTGYGNTVGYCVTAMNGGFSINHQMERVDMEDGSVHYVCRCCAMVQECAHEHVECRDLEDGTHGKFCDDCKTCISEPEAHKWSYSNTEDPQAHIRSCTECGLAEEQVHQWMEISNTATCTEPGKKTVTCTVCGVTQEQEAPARGHQLDNTWYHNAREHYQMCQICREEIEGSRGQHDYQYEEAWEDWKCRSCGALHDWVYCGNDRLEVTSATCKRVDYHCPDCGLDMYREGVFSEYHAYTDGICIGCGKPDPACVPPETEERPEDE